MTEEITEEYAIGIEHHGSVSRSQSHKKSKSVTEKKPSLNSASTAIIIEEPLQLEPSISFHTPLLPQTHKSLTLAEDLTQKFKTVAFQNAFCDALWRFLNLNSFGEDGEMESTSYQVCFFVFAGYFISDAMQRIYYHKTAENSWTQAISAYRNSDETSWKTSLDLSLKFTAGILGWTAGYKYIAALTQETLGKWAADAIGAAIGAAVALFVTSEVTEAYKKSWKKADHAASVDMAWCSALDAAIWSIVCDFNIYKNFSNSMGGKVLDSLAVGIAAGIGGFTLAGSASKAAAKWVLNGCFWNKKGAETAAPKSESSNSLEYQ